MAAWPAPACGKWAAWLLVGFLVICVLENGSNDGIEAASSKIAVVTIVLALISAAWSFLREDDAG